MRELLGYRYLHFIMCNCCYRCFLTGLDSWSSYFFVFQLRSIATICISRGSISGITVVLQVQSQLCNSIDVPADSLGAVIWQEEKCTIHSHDPLTRPTIITCPVTQLHTHCLTTNSYKTTFYSYRQVINYNETWCWESQPSEFCILYCPNYKGSSPGRGKNCSHLHISQIRSATHSPSCSVGTVVIVSCWRGRGARLTTRHHLDQC